MGEPTNKEFLSLHALGLKRPAVRAGAVWKLAAFRDDAVEAHATGLVEEGVTAAHDMLREANPSGLPRAGDLLQQRFPFLERQRLEALAIEPKEIKDEIDQGAARSGTRQGLLQRLETGPTVRQYDCHLAIDERIIDVEFVHRLRDFRKRGRPVVAVAGVQRDRAFTNAGPDAVAVEL